MKRYALFTFDMYNPDGGFNDFVQTSDSFDGLFNFFLLSSYDNCGQIVDTTTLEVFRLERE